MNIEPAHLLQVYLVSIYPRTEPVKSPRTQCNNIKIFKQDLSPEHFKFIDLFFCQLRAVKLQRLPRVRVFLVAHHPLLTFIIQSNVDYSFCGAGGNGTFLLIRVAAVAVSWDLFLFVHIPLWYFTSVPIILYHYRIMAIMEQNRITSLAEQQPTGILFK